MSPLSKVALATSCMLAMSAGTAPAASTIILVNGDGPGVGFNDSTAVAPVLNNPGTTLGQQRLNAFEAAMSFWEEKIDSDVDIQVRASWVAKFCGPRSATLASAGPRTVHRDFAGAPRANTFYVSALASSYTGTDVNGSTVDITTTFNSQLDSDPNCLGGRGYDYRINPSNPSSLTVASTVQHELGHGLGFLTLVDKDTGELFRGRDDQFSAFLEDAPSGRSWSNMSNAQRAASAVSNGDLVWNGPLATAQSNFLTAGTNAGKAEMFAPTTIQGGSSVSHFSDQLIPNELMEPRSSVPQGNWMTLKAMYDMGWRGNPCLTSDLPDDQWVMFSLECVPPVDENTVADILGDDITGIYDDSWIVFEYSPTAAGAYIKLALTDEMQVGKGYWIGQFGGAATVLDVPDDSIRTPSPIACGTRLKCFELPLRTVTGDVGFTLLGNPFRRDIPLNDMQVRTDSGTCIDGCTLVEADANGVVFPKLYTYNGATEVYDLLDGGDILSARAGAWAATVAGAEGLNPRLSLTRSSL